MKMKILILAITVCMIAAPAKADLFGFHLGNLTLSYNGASSIQTTGTAGLTTGALYRNIAPAGTAQFLAGQWGAVGSESLLISMTLSSLTSSSANATGTISFSDVDGTTVAGNIAGTWSNASGIPIFTGKLTTVTSLPAGATFDGHTGSVSMNFTQPQPWRGAIVQMTFTTNWFTLGRTLNNVGGSLDVSVVPVPAAFVLGLLGLGAAGLKLRKYT